MTLERTEISTSFLNQLDDWTEVDGVFHVLARALGVVGDEEFKHYKGYYRHINPTSDLLETTVEALLELGYLERRWEPETEFRAVPREQRVPGKPWLEP